MKDKAALGILGLIGSALLALLLILVTGGTAGEWHTGTANLCSDCHTMHFSMQHGWTGGAVSTTPATDGNWLSATGPNTFLLKAPVNQLCLACHDGQNFAPDVLGANANAAPTNGRQAGALNEATVGAPYDAWKGHTLGTTDRPPGYAPAVVGLTDWYPVGSELECTSCHTQHGQGGVYRNLGPRTLGSANLPNYVIAATNTLTADVWINIASQTGTVGNRTAAEFNPFYDSANVTFNRNDRALGTTNSSNRIDTQCAACHGNFHGSPGDATIGGLPGNGNLEGFLRHPTSKAVIGAAGGAGYGGHSTLTRYTSATTKLKVYASDRTGWTDASPGCVTCHKAHGNQNPFGLIFLNRASTSVGEEGGYASGQTQNTMQGYRNLCGQCHSQGNS